MKIVVRGALAEVLLGLWMGLWISAGVMGGISLTSLAMWLLFEAFA